MDALYAIALNRAGKQLQVFKIAVRVASVGLAADYRSIRADNKDAFLIGIAGGTARIIQIADQPLSQYWER